MIKKDLNTKQVGSLFGVDESTVRRWSLAGKIKSSSSAGGHRTFSYKNIMEFAKTKGLELTTNDDKKPVILTIKGEVSPPPNKEKTLPTKNTEGSPRE